MDYFTANAVVACSLAAILIVITLPVYFSLKKFRPDKKVSPYNVFTVVSALFSVVTGAIAGVCMAVSANADFEMYFLSVMWLVICEPVILAFILVSTAIWIVSRNSYKKRRLIEEMNTENADSVNAIDADFERLSDYDRLIKLTNQLEEQQIRQQKLSE